MKLNGKTNEITYAFDEAIYGDAINHTCADFYLNISNQENGQLLHVISQTPNPAEGFCKAGCFIQGLNYNDIDLAKYSKSEPPLISCIILLTFNCFFVEHFLIPSIIANTTEPYEIIIVYNGIATDLGPFKNFTLIQSETGCVSKGYNNGVAAAKGRYVAIFHDDCLVTTNQWHKPMIAALEQGAFAVSTEGVYNPHFGFEFLKGTPLLLTKENYQLIGGHDEFFFAGIEDFDFSHRIQSGGHSIKKIDIPYRHFNGMSTVILLSDDTTAMRILFGYCLIPENVIEKWKNRLMSAPETLNLMLAVHQENLNYFSSKKSLPINTGEITSPQQPSHGEYPALFNIRKTYQEWLAKQFS